jgi:hypothetical protein
MNSKTGRSRRGTVLIAVLVCMGFTLSILLGCVHMSLSMRRGLRQDKQMDQTHWLLEAGARKGLQSARFNENYQGESVTLDQPLANLDRAVIEIKILPAVDLEKDKRLKVTATIQKNSSNPETITMRSITLRLTN